MFEINLMSTKAIPHEGAEGEFYIALDDGKKLVPTALYKHEHEDLMATAQRPADHYDEIAEDFDEKRKLSIWNITIGVHGTSRVTDKDGNLVKILLAEDEIEAAEHAHEIEFVDGQNRSLALAQIIEMTQSGYPVVICVLDDPSENEVMDRFSEINGTAKPMSKDLLFEFDYKRDRLPANQKRAYNLVARLNSDPQSPLFNKIKFGNGSGFSAKTIVEFICSDSRDLIAAMNDAGKYTMNEQYQVLLKYWQAISLEDAADATLGSNKSNKGERKRMSAQKVAYATSICETVIEILNHNNKNLTMNNMRNVYHMWVNDILRVKKLVESDNGTMEYINVDGQLVDVVTDRWNGRGRARKAVQADHDLLIMAYNNQLRV